MQSGAMGKTGMPKALTIMGIIVSIIMLAVFVLDLAIQMPFSGAYPIMDIGFLICSAILLYLSFSTFREQ
jgi:hypothetical protein